MKKTLHLGCADCLQLPLLEEIRKMGFDGVAFTYDAFFFARESRDETIDTIAGNLQQAGLSCPQVHLPYYDIFASSETYDEAVEKRIHYALSTMKRLGARWGALHPMSASGFNYDRKKALEDNLQKIQGYLETAAKYDVGIAVENLPVFPDCPEHRFFTSIAEDHRELIDRLNTPLAGACWDFGHAFLNQVSNEKNDALIGIKTLGNRIKIVHAHNNYGNTDWHLSPALGSINWKEALDALLATGYNGDFSLECVIGRRNRHIKIAHLAFCAQAADYILAQM